ncbi:hypothetical protein [Vagococcus carniphilus]|uniref:hypothetical protein n=1 Tax=Vagococcus carniphilus TaxID=218144 RepID=UPI00165555D8|nr:hypothetical protein [Vagococcus carniphilus]QNN73130.1 hypothetical protein H9L18_00455 [Vagococcus carniphilus]
MKKEAVYKNLILWFISLSILIIFKFFDINFIIIDVFNLVSNFSFLVTIVDKFVAIILIIALALNLYSSVRLIIFSLKK